MAWKRDETNERGNEVLGLGGVVPDKLRHPDEAPEATGTSGDETEGVGPAGDVEATAGRMGGLRRSSGATGIDMGAGGNGTDIER